MSRTTPPTASTSLATPFSARMPTHERKASAYVWVSKGHDLAKPNPTPRVKETKVEPPFPPLS